MELKKTAHGIARSIYLELQQVGKEFLSHFFIGHSNFDGLFEFDYDYNKNHPVAKIRDVGIYLLRLNDLPYK